MPRTNPKKRVMFVALGLVVLAVLAACGSAADALPVAEEAAASDDVSSEVTAETTNTSVPDATAAEDNAADETDDEEEAVVIDTPDGDCETPFPVDRLRSTWQLTDFCKYEDGVMEEILSGGVPRDGIPPIDDPEFDTIAFSKVWLQPQSPVIAVEVNGDARAYPLAILTRHEIVNDIIGGVPVAVTFCPLCNSAIVFNREVDGQAYRFGVSGLLRNSDLVMWDDVTESWWQQFTGVGIVGTHTGDALEVIPSLVVGFAQFEAQYPAGQVLSPGQRQYGVNPYDLYDSSSDPFLFLGETDDRLFATARVLAGVVGGEAIAYPFETLEVDPVINDTVGGEDVVVFWQPGAASALDRSNIDSSRDVGMAAMYDRELDGQVLTFALGDDETIVDEETGSRWNVFGTAIAGELAGAQLSQRIAAPHFWFAWAAFRPDTLIYGQ